MKYVAKKWREWKHEAKARGLTKYPTDIERLANDLLEFMKINGGVWSTTGVVEKRRYVNIMHCISLCQLFIVD